MHPDIRIMAKKFGPIDSATVDLRPLTIFVGPSNTGKTYLAILIYALHKVLNGFPRFPIMGRYPYYFIEDLEEKDVIASDDDFKKLTSALTAEGHTLRFSDLPGAVRDRMQSYLRDENFLSNSLKTELERCFDLEHAERIIHMPTESNRSKISLEAQEVCKRLWNFSMEIEKSAILSSGNIEDMNLFSDTSNNSYRERARRLSKIANLRVGDKDKKKHINYLLFNLLDTLNEHMMGQYTRIYYLPAARSGIMQSHRVIAGSLVARSTRAGLERFPELPTFSGVMADFMRHLIHYELPDRFSEFPSREKTTKKMKKIADDLEQQTLGGRIATKRAPPGMYPEFVYHPEETKQDIRLSRSSSMVSELAPVVLFIRGNLRKGDTLIIEEPEAHLHPAAQTEMATALARLVRAGVRVVITTHSDWLLQQISNLMREGELGEKNGGSPLSPNALRPRDVGVWLFDKQEGSEGSIVREIQFDRIEGIGPSDYEDVAESLYNRSAELQNRLAETDGGDESEA